jgi:hypothetical protein
MNNTSKNYRDNTLMGELGSWNQQENKFRELFFEQASQDKVFLKMKLKEYSRIWYKYAHKASTTDERALLVMLQYQRHKLQTALYPGLLTRYVARTLSFIKSKLMQHFAPTELRASSDSKDNTGYNLPVIPVSRVAEDKILRVKRAPEPEITTKLAPNVSQQNRGSHQQQEFQRKQKNRHRHNKVRK